MSTPVRFDEVAHRLAENGYAPLPVRPRSKATHIREWSQFCTSSPDRATLNGWLHRCAGYGAAIACGKVLDIDIDCLDASQSSAMKGLAVEHLGQTIERIGRAPKTLLLYRVEGDAIRKRRIGQVDILGAGSYFLAFGIHPDTGAPYTWPDGSPLQTRLLDLPGVHTSKIDALCMALAKIQNLQHAGAAKPLPAFSQHSSGVAHSASGLITDGRDILLTRLVYAA